MNSLSGLEHAAGKKGRIHLYTGDGKGKTTAAAGLALRALGAGKTVLFCQFLKGGESGELAGLKQLGAQLIRAKCGKKFMSQMNEDERRRLAGEHKLCFSRISKLVFENAADVVVLDEVVDAVNGGLIEQKELIELIDGRPESMEIVLTGRNPSEKLISAADYQTDFICKKHPYQCGIPARKGIEF